MDHPDLLKRACAATSDRNCALAPLQHEEDGQSVQGDLSLEVTLYRAATSQAEP